LYPSFYPTPPYFRLHLAKFESAVLGLLIASLHATQDPSYFLPCLSALDAAESHGGHQPSCRAAVEKRHMEIEQGLAGTGGMLMEVDLRGMEFKNADARLAIVSAAMALHRCGALRRLVLYDVKDDALGENNLKDCAADADSKTGVALGKRLKAAWEWAALLGQVEVYGWRSLDISRNSMGEAGASALAEPLAGLTGLLRLDLGGNLVGPEGSLALSAPLASLSALKILDLSRNSIGEVGATALAGPLAGLTGLQQLDLGGNGITGKADVNLRAALSHIKGLDLWIS